MSFKGRFLVASASVVALMLGGCAAPQPDADRTNGETAVETPGSAPTTEEPSVESGTPELPLTFTSDDGVDIEVTSLDRVLVLDDASIEIAHALGVGDAIAITPEISLLEDLAAQAETRISTGGQGALTVEGVVALDPTLVLASNMRRHADLVTGLRNVGIPAALIDTSQPAADKISKTGELFGVAEAGDALAATVQEQIDQAHANVADVPEEERPRVMVLSSSGAGDSGQTTAAGQSTPAHEIVVAAGGHNTGAEAGLDRYQVITAEGLIAARPGIIVVAESELSDLGGEEGIWSTVPGLSGTPAAETQSLLVIEDTQIKFSGVSTGDAVLSVQSALFPEL